jgi:GNAT superfamily N-acetyltransferase
MVDNSNTVLVVAYDDEGKVAGFTIWALENPWTVEKMGLEVLFYVRPEARKSKLAKHMLDFAIELCKDRGAKMLYSSSTGGFDDDGRNARAYNALLRRSGFIEMPESRFLVKET